jgi:hypothetical protein
MVHFEKSYQFGKRKEKQVLPLVQDYFKREIQIYPEKFSKFDFFDNKYQYELKSRTNTLAKYPTTMITYNKCIDDVKLILLFNFLDCLAFIEYEKDKFDKFSKQMFSRAQIVSDEKEHIFIPIEDLTIIKQY